MAFINSVPVGRLREARHGPMTTTSAQRRDVVMVAEPTRRAVLKFAVGLAAALPLAALANDRTDDDFDLKELKKDVEELQYEEEVTDVGPDDREKNITRIKKKEPVPEYVVEEKEVLEEGDQKYDTMVAKEEEDLARIKSKFGKK